MIKPVSMRRKWLRELSEKEFRIRIQKADRIVLFEVRSAVHCFPSGSVVNNSPANAGDPRDTGLIPGLGRSPGEGNSNSLQHSCLGNPMDWGAWRATVYGVTKSQTQLSDWTTQPQTIHVSITWELISNTNSRAAPQTNCICGVRPGICDLTSSLGDSYPHWNLSTM